MFTCFFKVFKRHPQHAETLAALFGEMAVVHFVGTAYGFEIREIDIAQHADALMNEQVVNEKVSQAVKRDAYSDPERISKAVKTDIKADNCRRGKNEEEKIVVLHGPAAGLVMVPVQAPERAMHDVFVGQPGHHFNARRRNKNKPYVDDPVQCVVDLSCKVRNVSFSSALQSEEASI